MNRKLLFSIVLVGICVLSLVGEAGPGFAQRPQPDVQRPTSNPGQGKPDKPLAGSSPQVALGQPGLSFRYVKTFGVTEEAYPADVQHINDPEAVYVDGSDNLFVVEEWGSRVLKYRTSDGVNLLSIGKAGMQNRSSDTFDNPKDTIVDGSGNIWVVDSERLAKYDASGNFLLEFPSADPWNAGSDNGHFNAPRALAFDSAGRLYVSDANNSRIQVFEIIGGSPVYSTTIGVTGVTGTADGYFNAPSHLAFDSSDRLYVVDTNNQRVQRCAYTGGAWGCSTFFGVPGLSGTDLTHLSIWSNGITIRNDNIFIADTYNQRVLKCNTSAVCSVFAGVTGAGGSDNTHLLYPSDVAVDSLGNVYVCEYNNDRVQKFNSSGGYIGRFGVTQVPYVPDAVRYNTPWGVAVTADGSIYVSEGWGFRVAKMNAAGVQQWTYGVAGVYGSDNTHFSPVFWIGLAGNMAVDAAGRVYVPDMGINRIQILNANTGAYITTWGSYGSGPSQFSCPEGVAISPVNGDIYVTDRCNNRIQVFDSNRVYKTQLGTGAYGSSNTEFESPQGVAIDKNGIIYVADGDNYRVQKCTLNGTSYTCALFAGVTGESGNDFSHFSDPTALAVDASGRVYVADAWNQRVQVFDSSGAYLTTIGGSWGATTGQMRQPEGIAIDSHGYVYVTDSRNARIQVFAPGVTGWRQSNINGFGEIGNLGVFALNTFNSILYAGTINSEGTGAQIWKMDASLGWQNVMGDGFGDTTNIAIDHLLEYNGNLYASTENCTDLNCTDTNGGQLWRSSDGKNWNPITTDGFGDKGNGDIWHLAVLNNQICASTWDFTTFPTHGAQIWCSATGDTGTWSKLADKGIGDSNNYVISSMLTYLSLEM